MKELQILEGLLIVVAFGPEGHDGASGARLVDEVEGSAEEAGQGIGEGQPLMTSPIHKEERKKVNIAFRTYN